MYDTINIVQQLNQLPIEIMEETTKPFKWCGLLWIPKMNKFGYLVSYSSEIKNLKLTIRGNEISITNSIQKFYIDNNYQTFSYTQVLKAFEKLNKHFPFNIYEANVKKIAVGVVIQEESNPILNTWLSVSNKKAFPMLSKNNRYGTKFFLTEYDIKGYNKTTEVKHHHNIHLNQQLFRFEVEIKRINNINRGKNNIGVYTVQDLLNPIKYQKLANLLIEKYQKINKTPCINWDETTIKEKRLVASFKDTEIQNSIRKQHPDTFKKDKIQYNKLLLKLNDDNFQNTIISKLNQQIHFSINN
ncbi:hypothetical protein [Lutibacter sp. B1]|uniref:hypothetical protein n=1 Tax=Lutibacter sp. B1 TaxID=2725996 RepID=UPI0014564924|nr:hypothetical protein [Lutibacter sp. B1]NLP59229.1 hypothetical protein [Lutibacter sp. B1]